MKKFARSIAFFWIFTFALSIDPFIPNFDPIILNKLNIEYDWFEKMLEFDVLMNNCSEIDFQIPQIEFAYNTISNFSLQSTEETIKDLDSIKKLLGSLEIALDQQYEETVLNESKFTEELNNVQRELKKRIASKVLDQTEFDLQLIEWTDDLNETQYVIIYLSLSILILKASKIYEETFLLSIQKEIVNAQINEKSKGQVQLFNDTNDVALKVKALLHNIYDLYDENIKLNEQMILIYQLNSYIKEYNVSKIDSQKLEQSYVILHKQFYLNQHKIEQIQSLYSKMKKLLQDMIQQIEIISDQTQSHQNEEKQINNLIQKYEILSSIFYGIKEQEQSNKTINELINKQDYLQNYKQILDNLNEMYSVELQEIRKELTQFQNDSKIVTLKEEYIRQITVQQENMRFQLNQTEDEIQNITKIILQLQYEKKSKTQESKEEEIEINQQILQLEQNISKIQNWLHSSLGQIQNYSDLKIQYQNKLEVYQKQNNKKDEIKKLEYNIESISNWTLEQQKKVSQYQKYEESLMQQINELYLKQEMQKKTEIQEQPVFYSFVESKAKFIQNSESTFELENLLYKSEEVIKQLNKLKQGQSALTKEYEKLIKQKEDTSSVSGQFKNFLQMKGFGIDSIVEPEYKAIIESEEFKTYQKVQELNFLQKENELMQQQQLLTSVNEDINKKQNELEVISTNIDACVMICSMVAHKTEGTQLTVIASQMNIITPEDEISSQAVSKIKSQSSHRDNYISQLPIVYGKQFGEQEDQYSDIIKKEDKDIIHEFIKELAKDSWTRTKSTGHFDNFVSSSIIIFINPLQNNITSMVEIFSEVTQNITSSIVFIEDLIDKKENKSIGLFETKIGEKHKDFQYVDVIHRKMKEMKDDLVSSIVKITWTNVIGSISSGEPQDEVDSKVIKATDIETSFKHYSGRVQDYQDIKAIHNFDDSVSSIIKGQIQLAETSHLDNYKQLEPEVLGQSFGLAEEEINIKYEGRIKNKAFSIFSSEPEDEVSSIAIIILKDVYSQQIEKIQKDEKSQKAQISIKDESSIQISGNFEDSVSSKIQKKPINKLNHQNIWKNLFEEVSSRAMSGRNYKLIKSHYQVAQDEVSSTVFSEQKSMIHAHEIIKDIDVISKHAFNQLVSKIAIKIKSNFKDVVNSKIQGIKEVDQVSSIIEEAKIDQISSKLISTHYDKYHKKMKLDARDEVSSRILGKQQSIYWLKKVGKFQDSISSQINEFGKSEISWKDKIKRENKIKSKQSGQFDDSVSSQAVEERNTLIASTMSSQGRDEVSSYYKGLLENYVYVASSEYTFEDQVSSKTNPLYPEIQTAQKHYSGAFQDEAGSRTTYAKQQTWITSNFVQFITPQNNITSKIVIFKGQLNNFTSHIVKFVESGNNITSQIDFFETIGNNISSLVITFVKIEDNTSSIEISTEVDHISSKVVDSDKDKVSSEVINSEKDDISSKHSSKMESQISEKLKLKAKDKKSMKLEITAEDKIGMKHKSPQVIQKYSGKQIEWPHKHIYNGEISKCDCQDQVSSIVNGQAEQDYYSKRKVEQSSTEISQKIKTINMNQVGIEFDGEFIDEVSSISAKAYVSKISGRMKSKDLNRIGIVFSASHMIDQISSNINGVAQIQTSFKNYRGKIEDYSEMKGKHFFEDQISSKVKKLLIEDIQSKKMMKTHKDVVGSQTTWKGEDNITSIILPDQIMPNNLTSHITTKAEFNNVTSTIKIFSQISNDITSMVTIFKLPEDNISTKAYSTIITQCADIISWVQFEDQVSSQANPGQDKDAISSKTYLKPNDDLSEKDNYQLISKYAFQAKHEFQEQINVKTSGKLFNLAAAKTNYIQQNNLTTTIIFISPLPSNITSNIIIFEQIGVNITTEITKEIDIHNITTSITQFEIQSKSNITTFIAKFESTISNNISSSLVMFYSMGNNVTSALSGSISNEFSNRIYDGGIENNEKSSKTTCVLTNIVSTDAIFIEQVANNYTSELLVFSFENLMASKTSKKKSQNNVTSKMIIFELGNNNVTSEIVNYKIQNNVTSDMIIFINLQNNVTSEMTELIPIEDTIHSKAIESLIELVSSAISELIIEDQVSSKVYGKQKDEYSIDKNIPIQQDIIKSKDNVMHENKTARQSLVDYWLCDYVGEVFSYVAHQTTANVGSLQQYPQNELINTARQLALLLKNASIQNAQLKSSQNVDQLLELSNSYQMTGLNVHYYTQLRELLKAIKGEIAYFDFILRKQSELYQKRRNFKNLLDNLMQQKDKCIIKMQRKSYLRKRTDV